MRVKCIAQEKTESYRFFLFMMVPLTIGIMIFCTSLAYGVWDHADPNLLISPIKQGWVEMKIEES